MIKLRAEAEWVIEIHRKSQTHFSRCFPSPCPTNLFTRTACWSCSRIDDWNIIPPHFFSSSFIVKEKAYSRMAKHLKCLGFSIIWIIAFWQIIFKKRLLFLACLLLHIVISNAWSHPVVSIISNTPNKGRKLVEGCHILQLSLNSPAF